MSIEVIAGGKSYIYRGAEEPYHNCFGELVIKANNETVATFKNWELWRRLEESKIRVCLNCGTKFIAKGHQRFCPECNPCR